jgi:rRNA maturation RNase YbeY
VDVWPDDPEDAGGDEPIAVHQGHPTRSLSETDVLALAERVLEGEGLASRGIGIVLTDHAEVLRLNRDYLGHDYETDVLSFSLDESGPARGFVEGEVAVDLDTAAERAAEFGTTYEREALRYVAHGLLHLCGYDDATPDEKAAMHALEDRYLGPES